MTESISRQDQFVAIVLAGDRTENDPVAIEAGVSCKAIAPICGRAMILLVLDALEQSELVNTIVLCGPPEASLKDCPELVKKIEQSNISWLPSLASPSQSVEAALLNIKENAYVLLTTADHALLRSQTVSYFLSQSLASKVDATVGLVEFKTIHDAYPEVKRTVIKMSDGGYCGCNLFAFLNIKGRKLVPFWRQVEQSRKKPARMIASILGNWAVLLYLMGKLTLDSALARVSNRIKLEIKPIIIPFPEAGVDVDTAKDREFVERILRDSKD